MDNLLFCDIECYPNYLLIMLYRASDKKRVYFEKYNDSKLNIAKLHSILSAYTVVTYNGNHYDIPLINMAMSGVSNKELKKTSDDLIYGNIKPYEVMKCYCEHRYDWIDIIDVCPLSATLKIYGGRIHTKTIQDLPLEPDTIIAPEQLETIRKYCLNDTKITAELYDKLSFAIQLRESIGQQVGVDLRSKGDAQIAEALISKRIQDNGLYLETPAIAPGTVYHYTPPQYIRFQSPELNDIMRIYCEHQYTVTDTGHIGFVFHNGKKNYKFNFHGTTYSLGIGGIHSCEKSTAYYSTDDMVIEDNDVTSYYPNIILNNNYCPESAGKVFYSVYSAIVAERISAKKQGDKLKAQALKIPINACFGKFGSKYSKLYSPDLMIKVSITGQLSLLMLIEQLELNGIHVISANTDGIVTYHSNSLQSRKDSIIKSWSEETHYQMEVTRYRILASRDVNNYVAVKFDDTCKGKGAYADLDDEYYQLRSNPSDNICYMAAREYLISGKPIRDSVMECRDIRRFISIRTVTGGAVYDNQLIGKSIRYYHSRDSLDCFFYSDKIATTAGHKVPQTDGTVPCMVLPDQFPGDIDYPYYIDRAHKVLAELGVKI